MYAWQDDPHEWQSSPTIATNRKRRPIAALSRISTVMLCVWKTRQIDRHWWYFSNQPWQWGSQLQWTLERYSFKLPTLSTSLKTTFDNDNKDCTKNSNLTMLRQDAHAVQTQHQQKSFVGHQPIGIGQHQWQLPVFQKNCVTRRLY